MPKPDLAKPELTIDPAMRGIEYLWKSLRYRLEKEWAQIAKDIPVDE